MPDISRVSHRLIANNKTVELGWAGLAVLVIAAIFKSPSSFKRLDIL